MLPVILILIGGQLNLKEAYSITTWKYVLVCACCMSTWNSHFEPTLYMIGYGNNCNQLLFELRNFPIIIIFRILINKYKVNIETYNCNTNGLWCFEKVTELISSKLLKYNVWARSNIYVFKVLVSKVFNTNFNYKIKIRFLVISWELKKCRFSGEIIKKGENLYDWS